MASCSTYHKSITRLYVTIYYNIYNIIVFINFI
nr:MAG TPA: hypothetical protein [Caudoviricetes sp.]